MPNTDHLRGFAQDLEKCKAVGTFTCRKIKIMRTAIFFGKMYFFN